MKKLLHYLKGLQKEERELLAKSCKTTVGYIRKRASTGGLLNPITCNLIEHATNRAVTRKDLRPNDWQQIWPDLADSVNELEVP